jgi:hypothetical protein
MSISTKIFLVGVFSGLSLFALSQDSLLLKGQLSVWTHINPNNKLPWWSGGRFLPQLNYEHRFSEEKLFDLEGSLNIYGNMGLRPFDSSNFNGNIKPYRLWARYSGNQFEFRAGLQKINFGSASILRPLMWFDQIDPRDPLQLTDGVWGGLARYYFLNNANIWLWLLYGNNNRKGWETFKTKKNNPEFGGRIQSPVPNGEAAISYHHRIADCSVLSDSIHQFTDSPENRLGIDIKLDVIVGCWFESSWTHMTRKTGMYTNQHIINLGVDYTFALGSGLSVIFEQLLASYDEEAFKFINTSTFSLLNLGYPIGLFDNLSYIAYYDWKNSKVYNFMNWQHQFNKFSLYFMGYINPEKYDIPTQTAGEILYAGSGLQVMVVFNY